MKNPSHQILDTSAIPTFFILSHDLAQNKTIFPAHLIQALVAVQCLVHIVSPYPWSNLGYLGGPQGFAQLGRSGVLHCVQPQTYTTIAKVGVYNRHYIPDLLSGARWEHWPEIFVIHPGDPTESPYGERNFQIQFLCWYCRPKGAKELIIHCF